MEGYNEQELEFPSCVMLKELGFSNCEEMPWKHLQIWQDLLSSDGEYNKWQQKMVYEKVEAAHQKKNFSRWIMQHWDRSLKVPILEGFSRLGLIKLQVT